ncbi:MAG: helix-turn-helix domain-containing protein [Oligoflexia bacterium]|nr:helix-turn-helix domain-containing protein [Oligoflexia bacterium]
MGKKEKKNKRSARIIMTNEARVLKQLREESGLSMRAAGQKIGLSDSYIAHLENGRIDIPKKAEKLERILAIYGGIKIKSFYERAQNFKEKITPKDEIKELVSRANDHQVTTLLTIVKSIVGNGSN